ncbi:LolA family protein [Aegicerativicinus sediminis]|uniref:LolA family protein n=1 Tax=Aegicerativicinus sediminis TaxID=2893202 RepID=UPI001E514C16|nr:outer membrane lipoprotein carrier protein LolA [Aegicerativicinus sediminis]
MKLKKFLYSSLSLFFLCLSGFGQQQMSMAEAEILKEKVEKSSKNIQSLECNFVQTKHINMLENEVVSTGILYYKNPDNIKWEYLSPKLISSVFKGNQLYVIEEDNSKKIDLNSNKLIQNLNELVTNSIKGNIFDELLFNLTYFETTENYRVEFVPKEKKIRRYYNSFDMIFSKTDFQLNSLYLREANGDYTLIEFRDKKLNGEISDSTFKVN